MMALMAILAETDGKALRVMSVSRVRLELAKAVRRATLVLMVRRVQEASRAALVLPGQWGRGLGLMAVLGRKGLLELLVLRVVARLVQQVVPARQEIRVRRGIPGLEGPTIMVRLVQQVRLVRRVKAIREIQAQQVPLEGLVILALMESLDGVSPAHKGLKAPLGMKVRKAPLVLLGIQEAMVLARPV